MGTVFQVPWAYLGENWMEELKAWGFKTAAMALRDDSYAIDDEALRREPKLAVILGTEGDGLKQSTIDASDYTVKIPMYHGVDSLNVAAASAVAFWELRAR
jgi:tRNA G18 (ribose-2'-O)-methylase SpoU